MSSLRVRVEQGEVTTNNNRPRHLEEDTLYRVMAALEALSTQVPEEIRWGQRWKLSRCLSLVL